MTDISNYAVISFDTSLFQAEAEVVQAQGRDGNQPTKLKLKLKVAIAGFDHSGKYTIKATNTYGEDTADINVVVLSECLSFMSHLTIMLVINYNLHC